MAILTEKEIEVELGMLDAKIYAEYADGHIDSVYIILKIDGDPVTWSPYHRYGQICVMEHGELKRDWGRLQALINKDFFKLLDSTVAKLIK